MISIVETITDVTDKQADCSELESSCEKTRSSKGNVDESLFASPFSFDAAQWKENTEELRHHWASNGPTQCQSLISLYLQSAREL